MATPSNSQGKHWDNKDHAWEYSTKQPGTVWDAKDHAWEDKPGGDKKTAGKPRSKSDFKKMALKKIAKKGQVPPQFQKKQ